MSGYFARLAAQVNGPSVPEGRSAEQEPASLEQHVEVEVPAGVPMQEPMAVGAATPGLRRASAVKGAPPVRESHPPELATTGTADAGRALTMPGQDLAGRETPSMAPGRAAAFEPAGTAFAPANGEAMPVGSPAHRMAPAAMAAEAAADAEAVDPGARTAAASRPAPGLASSLPGQAASKVPARPYAGFSAPAARPRTADAVQPPPARPSTGPANEVAPAARHSVRIGTITLEVHAPAAPSPAAQQAPPAPNPAPQQVALRRHYLRWS
jgi:hypothetical protein